jgi:uncharacterized protein (DUF58 family)
MTQEQPRFAKWMGSLWLYTLLRFALFLALWGILLLVGLGGLLAALIALVLSVPIALFALSRPRAAVARQMEARVAARQHNRAELDDRLQHDE